MLNILNAKLIVIKIGSSLLFTSNKTLRLKWVQSLVDDISLLLRQNLKIVIVTSGAIALGCKKLKINKKNLKLNEYQAVAALGQIELMNIFKNAFSKKRINVAQILLTLDDTENRRRSLNAKDTIRTLHKINILPIVNENDTTATSEIRYGDNDRLAARVAQITEADTLIMLSDIDGLFTKNPKKYKDAKIINKITKIDKKITDSATKSLSDYGSGGMITKIEAAKICMNTGCNMIISNGLKNNPIKRINKFKKFTWFVPKTTKVNSKKKWILSSINTKGAIIVDDGARKALLSGKSLLPVGIVNFRGFFQRGDTIQVLSKNFKNIAICVSAYSSEDISQIKGLKSEQIKNVLGYSSRGEVIHANNMVISENE